MDKKHLHLPKVMILSVSAITLGIFVYLAISVYSKPAILPSRSTTRQIVMSCTTDMATEFHIHPVLTIVINGKKQVIPENIGIVKDCMHPIHTHDTSGVIHVESPEQRDFTLADFFAVWDMTFNKNQILDAKVDATHTIVETVNGQVVQDYENTLLRDKDQIVITYAKK